MALVHRLDVFISARTDDYTSHDQAMVGTFGEEEDLEGEMEGAPSHRPEELDSLRPEDSRSILTYEAKSSEEGAKVLDGNEPGKEEGRGWAAETASAGYEGIDTAGDGVEPASREESEHLDDKGLPHAL